MKKTTFSLFVTLLYLQWHSIFVESAGSSEATVTGAMQKTNNQYMAVVEDDETKSGWAVEVKKDITEKQSTDDLFMFFQTRTDPQGEFKLSFAAQLCNLLLNSDKPTEFLYKQLTEIIFRKQNGSCKFKPGERAIGAKGPVNTTPSERNPGNFMPKTTPFEVEALLVDRNQANSNDLSQYLFKVNFKVQ